MAEQSYRPRSLTDILDAAIHLVRDNYAPLFVLSALAFLPGIVQLIIWPPRPDITLQEAFSPTMFGLVSVLWFTVIDGALVYTAGRLYTRSAAGLGEAIRAAFTRLLRLLVMNIVRGLIMLAPVVLFGIVAAILIPMAAGDPGATFLMGLLAFVGIIGALIWMLYFMARLLVATPLIMLEDAGTLASLGRSSELTRGNRWRGLGAIIIMTLIFMLAVIGVSLILGLFNFGELVEALVSQVVLLVLYPLAASVITVYYYDLRIRKEGFDLELMARSLEQSELNPVR